MTPAMGIEAVTFDFYNTLAHHRAGRGRGAMLMEYLESEGLEPDPWEHQVLYDIFEPHAREYQPGQSADVERRYLARFARRVFDRLNVEPPESKAEDHAIELWRLLGPASLAIYSDVVPVLESLQREGLPVAVVSNWQCGLGHFCVELGIGHLLDHVVASAEVGRAKPDAEIFREACRRLGTPPERTLHVGDTITDDLDGARNAGLQAILVRQTRGSTDSSLPILDLHRVLEVCESGRTGGEPLEESRG